MNTSPPAVSVVIPAYNAAPFIERTLATLKAQTYRDFEVIVVDDGSKDETAGVVDRYLAANGLRGRAIKQANKKIAGARNTGVAAAAAPVIAFLDHDDLWTPEKLEVVMGELARDPSLDAVHHPCRITTPEGKPLGMTHNGYSGGDLYRKLLLYGNAVCPSAVTVKKTKIAEAGGFREDPCFDTVEDYDLWMRLARVARWKFLDRVMGDYLWFSSGASRRVVYHHANLETLLRDHFARYERQDAWTRLLMRRRLSQVSRAAARALTLAGDKAAARPYIGQMLARFPVEPKNLAVALWWAAR